MKKTLLVLALIVSVFATDIFAQNKNSIKLAPVEMVRGAIGLTYERALPNNTSLILSVRYTDFSRVDNNRLTLFSIFGILIGDQYHQEGFDVEFSFRKYFGGKAFLNGFYLQPGIGAGHYKISHEEEIINFLGLERDKTQFNFSEELNVSSFSLRSGYQWVFKSGFTLDIGMGLRVNKTFGMYSDLIDNKRLNGLKPMANLKLGYAF